MANMLMMRYAAQRSAESEREPMRRDMPHSAYSAPQQPVKQPVHDDYDGGVESRYQGKDGRWKAGTRRSEYEADEPSYDPMEDEPSERMPSNVIPMHEPRGNYRVNRQIGFGAQNSMHQDERMSEPHSMGKAQGMEGSMEFDRQTAEKWVRSMRNEDKVHPVGGKWSPDMLKPLAQKYGIPTDGKRFWEFYAMTNAMYSDYGEVARKFGITSPEFYVCMAKAWMNDKDAEPDKTALYYEHIVKKD